MSRPPLVLTNEYLLLPPGTPTCMSDGNFPLVAPLCKCGEGRRRHWKTTGDARLVTCMECLCILGSTIYEEEI